MNIKTLSPKKRLRENINPELPPEEKLNLLIKKFNLSYSITELNQIMEDLGIKNEDISIENIIAKTADRRSELKFCLLYHDLNNFIQSPSEQIMKILTEAQAALEESNKVQLAKSVEWVMLKIQNEEIYDIEYDDNKQLKKRNSNSGIEEESKKKIFNDFSLDVFSQNKKANILAVKNNVNKRMSFQNTHHLVRKSVFAPLYGQDINTINIAKTQRTHRGNENKNQVVIVEEDEDIKNDEPGQQGGERSSGTGIDDIALDEKDNSNKNTQNFETIDSSNNLYKVNINENPNVTNSIFESYESPPFDDVNFNIFDYNEKTKFGSEYILNHISYYVFEKYNLFCLINESRFDTFLNKIKVGYDNLLPYHNHIHAADVLQTCNVYAIKSKLQKEMELNDLDMSGFFISAIIHDYKHPGLNNAYQINKRTDIANKYNDVSVLENFHVSSAFKVMSDNNSNILLGLTVEEYRVIRKRIIECVLATDMARHSKSHHSLKIKIKTFQNEGGKVLNSLVASESEESKFDRQQDILNYLLHCSDISNPTKSNDIYVNWTKLVIEEFHNQGDLERSEKLPISFMCDRNNFNLPKSQIGFITNILFPCFSLLVMIAPDLDYTLKNLDENLKKRQLEADMAEKIEKEKKEKETK